MFNLEEGKCSLGVCPECSGRTGTAIGFVSRDEEAYAVYYFDWCENHAERSAFMTLSIGEWWDDATPDNRFVAGIHVEAEGMMLASSLSRDDPQLFGEFLDREAMLAKEDLSDFWEVVDHIVLNDTRVYTAMEWLHNDIDSAWASIPPEQLESEEERPP